MAISTQIFRAYDIRGLYGDTLTLEAVAEVGKALATTALRAGETTLIVGRDGRHSSPEIHRVLTENILSTGCNVLDIGMVPSPVTYFATYHCEPSSAVMITGSHNPAAYNGLKMLIQGKTLTEGAIQALYQQIQAQDYLTGEGIAEETDVIPAYIDTIVADVKLAKPLKVVIDCGNGIGGCIAETLFQRLSAEVIPLFCDVDGDFPNHHPDPSIPENLVALQQVVREHHADIGLAFDGDADRLGVVTNNGTIIWPDRQMMLFAQSILKQHPGGEVIFDVKCSQHLPEVILQAGGKPLMWKTGHSLIKGKLKESGAPFAGEMSGHLFFNDRWPGFDDGLYAGCRLLEILSQASVTADELFARLPNSVNTPELKLPVPEAEKFALVDALQQALDFSDAEIITIDGLRINFPNGWALVRASNTSPNLTLRFEAEDAAALADIQQKIADLIKSVRADAELPY